MKCSNLNIEKTKESEAAASLQKTAQVIYSTSGVE